MALTSRERNMIIGIVTVLVIAAIVGAYFLGTRGGEETTTATTPTATQTTQTVVTVNTVTQTTTTTPPPVPAQIVEQSINPSTVSRSGPLAITVRTQGDILSVKMDINGPQPMTVDLNRGPTVNNITTWAAAATAPGIVGLYRYSAKASVADGTTIEAPVSTFTVVP